MFVQICAPKNYPKNVTSHTLPLALKWIFSEKKQYLRLPFKIKKHAHFKINCNASIPPKP